MHAESQRPAPVHPCLPDFRQRHKRLRQPGSQCGALTLATPTPGHISTAGQLDEWTFFDYGGRTISILVNPGSGGSPAPVSPQLQWANVQLLDSNNNVLATAADTTVGGIISLSNIILPADGTYKIHVNAAAGHTASTGNYLVSPTT